MKTLNNIFIDLPKRKKRKIVGRGVGSGRGRSSCRGRDGCNSRSGSSLGLYEGGQQPIHRRIPKRGFAPINHIFYDLLTTTMLKMFVESGDLTSNDVVDLEFLISKGVVSRSNAKVKLLLGEALSVPLFVSVHAASNGAVRSLEMVGGSVTIL